jgi:hypothetical protein
MLANPIEGVDDAVDIGRCGRENGNCCRLCETAGDCDAERPGMLAQGTTGREDQYPTASSKMAMAQERGKGLETKPYIQTYVRFLNDRITPVYKHTYVCLMEGEWAHIHKLTERRTDQ